MRKIIAIILTFTAAHAGFLGADCGCSSHHCKNHTWETLREGNDAFVKNPKFAKQRKPFAHQQNPHEIILSCADSRVTPEFIFNKKIGDLFVVRSAGQVADDVVVDSIEFAVRTFDSCVLVVMGHTDCGAVRGALGRLRQNGGHIDTQIGHLLAVLIPIETAIVESGMNIYAHDALKQATRVNVRYIADLLISESDPIREAVACGKLSIVGAEYNLKSGKVKHLFTIDD